MANCPVGQLQFKLILSTMRKKISGSFSSGSAEVGKITGKQDDVPETALEHL